jgi:hypothetical protein
MPFRRPGSAKSRGQGQQAEKAGSNSKPAKVYGGSTITQQLAKNLLLSGERNFLRKGQELVLAQLLELMLSKQRILEIYLNNVEWGQGVFGAEAAARHYFRKSAAQLNAAEAARLAAMLPAPKRFEKMPQSRYLAQRSRTIARYIPMVTPPEALRLGGPVPASPRGGSCLLPPAWSVKVLYVDNRQPCEFSESTPACRPRALASSTWKANGCPMWQRHHTHQQDGTRRPAGPSQGAV